MNALYGLPEDLLKALRVQIVRAHLASLGWTQDEDASDEDAALYLHPDEPQVEVLVPLRRDLVDFVDRMADLVHILAIVNQKRNFDMLNELLYPDGDFFRFRLTTNSSLQGSVGLTSGVSLYVNSKRSLLAAACSTHKKQLAYSTLNFRETSDFIGNCRLGQSEIGSYVVTVINPIPPVGRNERQEVLFKDGLDEDRYLLQEPFSRRVSIVMMRGLDAVKDAVNLEATDLIVEDVPDGVSANLCEALVAMRPESRSSKLEIRVRFSAARPWRPAGTPHVIEFAYDDFDFIDEVGKKLRGKFEEEITTIEGYVVDLHADMTADEDLRGTITIQRVGKNRGPIIKVKLRERDYVRACDAHRDKKMVSVAGKVYKDNKMKTSIIKDYKMFSVTN